MFKYRRNEPGERECEDTGMNEDDEQSQVSERPHREGPTVQERPRILSMVPGGNQEMMAMDSDHSVVWKKEVLLWWLLSSHQHNGRLE